MLNHRMMAVSGACLLVACSASAAANPKDEASPASGAWREVGRASWYGSEHHGKRTASGARFDMNGLTAAHRTLPLGTVLRVENLANGRSIMVRVNDRGPYVTGRIIDLSMAAASRIGLKDRGTGLVVLNIVPATTQ